MGQPRFNSISPINENDPLMSAPIKRLAWGTIVAGLLITSNITPAKTPIITIPFMLKLAALLVTILGLLIAVELANLTSKQIKVTPTLIPHNFSNMLGFYPAIMHRLPTKFSLFLGRTLTFQLVDQTWLEKLGPQAILSANLPLIKTTSNSQQGITKTFLAFFFVTILLSMILIAP